MDAPRLFKSFLTRNMRAASRNVCSEAASPIGAAPNATLRSLELAGLRRGLARFRRSRILDSLACENAPAELSF